MKTCLAPVMAYLVLGGTAGYAQKNELGLALGRIEGTDRTGIAIDGGTALQANYARTLWQRDSVAVQLEAHFLANPLREVDSADRTVTRDFATLYLTPGVRLKLRPAARVSPWVSVGGGYALYEQSATRLDGSPNPAPRHLHRGALQFGGGVDVKVWRWFGLRGEFRDFYTGNPALNRPLNGGQHNLVAGGGLLLFF
jgi:hypothetical protein